jgi:hypothetical protein
MMVCADPQKTRLVNGDGVFYGRTLSMKAE